MTVRRGNPPRKPYFKIPENLLFSTYKAATNRKLLYSSPENTAINVGAILYGCPLNLKVFRDAIAVFCDSITFALLRYHPSLCAKINE